MSYKNCISEVEKAVGRSLSMDEAEAIFDAVQKREKHIRADETISNINEAIKNSADELAKQLIRASKIEKRNSALQFIRRAEAFDSIITQFASRPEYGMESLLNGVLNAKVGARDSAAAKQISYLNKWKSGLIYDLESANTLHILTSGEFDLELSRALFTIDNPAVPEYKGLKEVKTTAEIIHKWQEVIRNTYNDFGGAVDKLTGYIVKQSHDSNKIRIAGKEKWIANILDKLDVNKTFDDGADAKEVLGKIYDNFISGVHLKTKGEVTGFKGGTANLAKAASADRVLHFKDADSWYAYHKDFGIGSISDAIQFSMQNAAQNIGLMSKLGPNPRDNWNRIIEMMKRHLKNEPEKLAKFMEATKTDGYLDNRFAEVDGTSRIPINGTLARIGSGTRVIESMSKLGGSLLSSITDLGTIMSEMRYQGHDMFGAIKESIINLTTGMNKTEMREIDAGLGVIADSMRGELMGARSFAEDNLPGALAKAQMAFFKLNGLTWWTDSLRTTAIRLMSHLSALKRDLPFDKIGEDLQRVFFLYGIDAGKWDIIRQAHAIGADKRSYLLPSLIQNMNDDVFANYLTSVGKNATPFAIKNIRTEIETQFSAYFHDRADFAVLQPDAQTRAILNQGIKPGTPAGELLRFVTQFKSFPVAYVQKILGREIYGRGVDPSAGLMDALKNGNGEISGLAQQFIWSTLFGYISYNAKDLLKGRTTEKPESAADYAKIVQAAMLQGGGLGLPGDYLFGEMKNRYGAGPLSGSLGPTFSTAESILDLYGRAKNGDDLAAAAVRTVINNTPFANIFYLRAGIDYMITYRIQEALNPGYLSRMEATVKKEQGKTFIFPPSQYVR